MKFRSKPATCEAMQFRDVGEQVPIEPLGLQSDAEGLFVVTAHGHRTPVADGDYIVAEPDGRGYYPVKPDIFEARWEPADKPTAVRLFPIPPGTARTKCQRCPEMIFHVPNTKNDGGTMPLSIEPELKTKLGYVATAAKAPTSEEEGYGFSHFSNCPAAPSFRKGFVGLEILIMLLFAAVFLFASLAAYIEAHTDNRCLAHGYPESKVTWTLKSYCNKRVNQTDTVVLLSDLEKK